MKAQTKQQKRHRRHKRIRARVLGTARRPRLCVFRSAKHIYGQLIDDEKGKTLVAASDRELNSETSKESRQVGAEGAGRNQEPKTKEVQKPLTAKIALAYGLGKLIAERALEKKIEKVVFDRRGDKYHGRIRAFADGARKGGLRF